MPSTLSLMEEAADAMAGARRARRKEAKIIFWAYFGLMDCCCFVFCESVVGLRDELFLRDGATTMRDNGILILSSSHVSFASAFAKTLHEKDSLMLVR